jgi:hypothetical protein
MAVRPVWVNSHGHSILSRRRFSNPHDVCPSLPLRPAIWYTGSSYNPIEANEHSPEMLIPTSTPGFGKIKGRDQYTLLLQSAEATYNHVYIGFLPEAVPS